MGNKCGSGQQDTDLSHAPKITVLVKGAYGLPEGDWQPGDDRIFTFRVGAEPKGQELFISSQKPNVVDPNWNEECELPANMALTFSIFQEGSDGNPIMVAYAILDLAAAGADSFNGELPLLANGENTGGVLSLKAKSADDYPADVSGEFNVSIENEKKKALGIEVDGMDPEKLYVTSVKKNSVVDIYNESQPDNKVEPGLFVMGVEGPDADSGGCLGAGSGQPSAAATPSDAMAKILKNNPKQVDLTCRRAIQFRVVLTLAADKTLGINVPKKAVGNSLIVTSLQDETTPVSDWNTNNPDQTVEPWDRITAVDGKSGKAADLQKHIKTAQQSGLVILTLVRMAPTVNGAPVEPGEEPEESPEAGEAS